MTVVPKTYSYAPGATTAEAHISGIRAMLAVASYWTEESGGTATSITAASTVTAGLQWSAQKVGTGSVVTIECRLSIDDGATWSPWSQISGPATVSSSICLAGTSWGAATDIAWIVETEDSISLYTRATGSSQNATGPFAGALGFGSHAGKIFTPDNRSDNSNNIAAYGILGGLVNPIGIAQNTVRSLQTGDNTDCFALVGSNWEAVKSTPIWMRGRHTTSVIRFPAAYREQCASMGDAFDLERLAPIRIQTATSGTTGNMRYWRARYFAVSDIDSAPIDSTSVRLSAASPTTIAWRHSSNNSSASSGFESATQNTVYLWSPTIIPLTT